MKTKPFDYLDDVIDETVIASCISAGASAPALNWLQERPRTYRELRERSESWYIWLAENVAIPWVLEVLAGDAGVRWCVARNVNTPAAVLEKLAGDADADVRRGVALNVNTPVAVLGSLAGDADAFVRYCAQSRLALLLERSSYEDETV